LIIAFLLIIGLFGFGQLAVGNFFSLPQVLLTIKLASFIALFGLCQMFVISAGGDGLDLSVGYMATMTAVFTASIMDGKTKICGWLCWWRWVLVLRSAWLMDFYRHT
jgi:ribose transport system permease protein